MIKPSKLSFERKLFWSTASVGLVLSCITGFSLWYAGFSPYLVALLVILLTSAVLLSSGWVYEQIKTQFQTMTNLLEAVSNGDYGLRSRQARGTGALAELTLQINLLADTLTRQHFEVKESQMLLGKVMSQINVAIFAWNEQQQITLANNAGSQLLASKHQDILNQPIDTFFPDKLLSQPHQLLEHEFPGLKGRFSIVKDQFMENNHKHTLLFITNVQEMLRAEELKAWQNLIRVISHEINNSLVPINSLSQMLMTHPVVISEQGALKESLEVIAERAQGLTTFVNSYRKLSKVPTPIPQSVRLLLEVEKVIKLYPKQHFEVHIGNEIQLNVDPPLFQQVLINLTKNAIEAQSHSTAPQVPIENLSLEIRAALKGDNLYLTIRDFGPGISNLENLFVPFYSTKPKGSGIGLILCRQIIEAHDGQLQLSNHPEKGCIATVMLPAN